MTESAAILIWLAEQHPGAALAPAAGDPRRGAFLRFYAAAPRMGEIVRRVDTDPRLAAFWSQRYPFADGWDRI